MQIDKRRLFTSSAIPAFVGLAASVTVWSSVQAADQTTTTRHNPVAIAKPQDFQLAASCNPCGPCNPCAAGANYATDCAVPRLAKAAPCHACNPCSPCAGAATPELSHREAAAAFDCIKDDLIAAYGKSGVSLSGKYRGWTRYSTAPYLSDAHGLRYVNNYTNETGRDYGNYEEACDMAPGTIAVKESFVLSQDGRVGVGPLFIMEKHAPGSFPERRDWSYAMILPNGALQDQAAIQQFCNDCHIIAGDEDDNMMFLPDEYRVGVH